MILLYSLLWKHLSITSVYQGVESLDKSNSALHGGRKLSVKLDVSTIY